MAFGMRNEQIFSSISQASETVFSWVKNIREHIHENPELSFQEHHTTSYIIEKLKEIGIDNIKSISETGVIALIQNSKSEQNECIALRADIDALPIVEMNEVEYKSKREGVMHACGHDVHSAVLLGAAKIIFQNKEQLKNPVKLIFQPGEEVHPGGASVLIEAGVLKHPKVTQIYGLHVYPELEAGKIGIRSGMYMASSDELFIQIEGKGGHGALPDRCINPIEIGAEIILKAKAFIEKENKKNIPTVVSFGYFTAEGSTNVIPNFAKIKGTFRTLNESWREEAIVKLSAFIEDIGNQYGAHARLRRSKGYPCLINDEKVTKAFEVQIKRWLGDSIVVDLPIRMTAEDFAFYAQQVPACFFRLGVRNESKGIVHSVHHPMFDIEEESLKTGVKIMASIPFL